jgi:hypothetical protein
MAVSDIPVLVKHCALAIFKSGDVVGDAFKKTQDSFKIARHRLTEYGFLVEGSQLGGPENIRLTGKGHTAESRHRRESDNSSKVAQWDKLYALIQEDAEDLTSAATDAEVQSASAVLPREIRDEQVKQRRAGTARRMPRVTKATVPKPKRGRRA